MNNYLDNLVRLYLAQLNTAIIDHFPLGIKIALAKVKQAESDVSLIDSIRAYGGL